MYREGLLDLSPAELDLGCREALRTSEYLPRIATIRSALYRLQAVEVDHVVPHVETEQDRALELERIARAEEWAKSQHTPEQQKARDDLRKKLGLGQPQTKITELGERRRTRAQKKSLNKQIAEMKKRGWL